MMQGIEANGVVLREKLVNLKVFTIISKERGKSFKKEQSQLYPGAII